MDIRISSLDNETFVIQLEKGDTGPVVDLMNKGENGFAVMGEDVEVPMAVVDGRLLEEEWFTQDHILAIEAHELGHIRTNSIEEADAEREGIRLLMQGGHFGAAQLLIERGIVGDEG